MKLLSATQIRDWDAYTIEHEPISFSDLIERAGTACAKWIVAQAFKKDNIYVFCGTGNNGADGLAIARILSTEGYVVNTFVLDGLAKAYPVIEINAVVIDALFGTGLNRPLSEYDSKLVQHVNDSGATVISIDLPSGMPVDQSCKDHVVVNATYTLTFQSLKLCFLMPENAALAGEITMLDIGLDKNYPDGIETQMEIVSPEMIASMIPRRSLFAQWSRAAYCKYSRSVLSCYAYCRSRSNGCRARNKT
jgi:NAD(P)H-hydrate repair Nnr-like enzyme with NAD(P)H-hydrate epimerase domain